MNKKIFLTEAEKKAIILEREKAIINSFAKTFNKIKRIDEVFYGDSDGDSDFDMRINHEASQLYDKGMELFHAGDVKSAEEYRQMALKKGAWLGWGEKDLPPYKNINEVDGDLLEFDIPEWALSSLINGDDSGLEDEDIQKINSFVQKVVNQYGNANFMMNDIEGEDNLGFKHSNDIDNLGSNVYRLYLRPSKNQMNEFDGDDYEQASRGVEYGVDPYSEKPSLFDNVAKIYITRPEFNGSIMDMIYGIYIMYKDGKQEKIRSIDNFNQKFGTNIPSTRYPDDVVSYLETNHPEVSVYLDEFDVS